ncbi:hypothetical protein BGW38_008794 [Lunasporangiospora selenospora]|uniref:Amino acid permease-like protein n=1 Tax=Lunasporangiospora selenospora TaxID=979761 RepID=A0A9P6FJW3_9FUNG|nr:hypothetical protein BGW38_008794 [Lunasporangiospora selenospora]
MPGSKYLHKIHPTLDSPVWGVWLSCFVSGLLGLLYLADPVAFSAITSIATIGLYISYGIPTFCRITYARDSFEPGPVSLGRFSIPIGVISCVWIVIITVLFVLPTSSPVTAKNMNYTVAIVAASAIYIFANWYFNARHWFKGPVSNIDLEDNHDDFVAGSEKVKSQGAEEMANVGGAAQKSEYIEENKGGDKEELS